MYAQNHVGGCAFPLNLNHSRPVLGNDDPSQANPKGDFLKLRLYQAPLMSVQPPRTRIQENDVEDMFTPPLNREISFVLAQRTTSARTSDPNLELDWETDDDPQNPLYWSSWYKGLCCRFT